MIKLRPEVRTFDVEIVPPPKIENIQADVDLARSLSKTSGRSWVSYIDWETYTKLNIECVEFDNRLYTFDRYGNLSCLGEFPE